MIFTGSDSSTERSRSSSVKSLGYDSNKLEENKDDKKQEDVLLDNETLELLGEKAGSAENNDLFLHSEIGDRWEIWSREGLKKEDKQSLLKNYPRKGNYHFEAPEMNAEVEASINDSVKKRDKFFAADQNILGSAISALGNGVSVLLRNKSDEAQRSEALQCFLDAGKLLSESFHRMTKTRKTFVYPSLEKKAKELLEKEKTDTFLFGKDLSLRIKSAKSMEKVGLTLKPQQQAKKFPAKPSTTGNWRAPPARNRPFYQAGYKSKNNQRELYHGRYQKERIQNPGYRQFSRQPNRQDQDNRQQPAQK